jgi:heme-degrading monooxygenase HmoA
LAFLFYAVHYPRPEKEDQLVLAMREFGELIKKERGVVFVDTFRNPEDGTLVTVSLWDSKEAFQEAWPALAKRAPSQQWEFKPREPHMLNSVA